MQEQQNQPATQPLNPQSPNIPDHNQQSFDLHESKALSIISHQSTPEHLLKYFTQYTPKLQSFPLQQVHKSPILKLKRYKQSIYYGEYTKNKRNGYGIMIYNNGRLYEGSWVEDVKVGIGYEKFDNQCVYRGEYAGGKPDGVGKYVWANGEFYEGEWKGGVKNGSGMWRGAKGDTYIGEWKEGKADGYGVHTWINGDRYEGEFKQCLKHGQGVQKFANGDIYKGQYQKGKPSGFGQYYWQNSSYFKGQFKQGLRQGQGIWKRSIGNSDKYQGQYKNDKKQGYGIFTWATGNIYKGQYKNDIRNGYGEMFWSDGSYYKGQWKNGIQHGEGELYVPGEGLKKGMFQDNVLVIVEKEEKTQEDQRYVNDPEKYGNLGKKGFDRSGLMPSKLPVRVHKSRSIKPRQIDENMVVRYTSTQPSNNNRPNLHPLLPRKHLSHKRQQKFLTIQRNAETSFQRSSFKAHPFISPFSLQNPLPLPHAASQKSQKQRILHSSFYMHQIHNRATTSINGSRAQVQSGYSGSVEYRGRRRGKEEEEEQGRQVVTRGRGNVSAVVEEMRYFNRTRLSRDVRRTPNM